MPETKRPLKVFLCHAHSDMTAVHDLYLHLIEDGVDAWLDKEKLLPGQDWEYEISKAVRETDVVVVCLSKQFNQAGFRQKEVRLALDTAMEQPEGEIFIIPARVEECDVLESLRKRHWVDLFEENGYEMLTRALRARADKVGVTLKSRKNRTSKFRKRNEAITSEKDTNKANTFEPININSNSVIKADNLDKAEHLEKARIEQEEIKKRRLPYFETTINRNSVTQQDSGEISPSGLSAKREFPESGEQLPSKKSKGRRLIITEYLVAIIGAVATIIAAIIGMLPQIFKSLPVTTATLDTQVPFSTFAALIPSSTPSLTLTSAETGEPTIVVYDPHPDASDYFDPRGIPMRLIPAGEFSMGSEDGGSDERPVHTVYLDAYYIDKYEVTNTLYKACVDNGVCLPPENNTFLNLYDFYGNPEFDNHPVLFMSWEMAKTYCEWRGGHLPTEAQWEKAARGLDERTYPWGEEIDQTLAHYDQSGNNPAPIGFYEGGKSPYRVYDMAGNAWEWVADWYSQNFYANSPTYNPSGPGIGQYKVLRGGTWYDGKDKVRASDRMSYPHDEILIAFGFRCARDANP